MKTNKLLVCILAVALLLCACQPTPAEEIVVNKGDGTLEEAVAAEALPPARYEAPETLRLDPFGTETFEVVVAAEVSVPNVEQYPIVEVTPRTITADWARDMMNRMADGRTMYSYRTEVPTTKEQIEAEIALLQQQLANPDDYLVAGMDEQARAEAERQWREQLEAWEALYQVRAPGGRPERRRLSNEVGIQRRGGVREEAGDLSDRDRMVWRAGRQRGVQQSRRWDWAAIQLRYGQ